MIPDDLDNQQIIRVQMYTYGLRQVKKDPTKFTDGMNCAICHKPHSFDKCPILNDILLIKKHFISYCLQMNKTQKQMLAAIHSINATWDTSTNNNNDDDDGTTTNNDQDFQEEEE